MSAKIEEGEKLVHQAEKSLKTTLTKWRPDYDSAADEYSKAATAFRLGKSYDKSKECLLKAIDCYKNNKSWFHAAKMYEQIVLISKEKNNLVELEENVNRACNLYQQHGSPESAAATLHKAAKMVEDKHPDIALRFYQHAMEVILIEDSPRHAAEYASKVARILVKLRRFDEAVEALRKEMDLNQKTESYGQIGRLTVALVLVQLARGDTVAAEKAFKEWGTCCDAQEVAVLENLLQAIDEGNADIAGQLLGSPFIKHMDVEYAILARDIPLPRGLDEISNKKIKDVESEVLEDDGGLC